jgi:hypothetical protein
LKQLLKGAWLGAIVGVLSAIIAFLIAYNALIIQIYAQKEEMNTAHQQTVEIVANFRAELENFKRLSPALNLQFIELIEKIEEIGQSRVYISNEVDIPEYDIEHQKLWEFATSDAPRTIEDKQRLYSLAFGVDSSDLKKRLAMEFAESMDQKDWPAFADLLLDGDALQANFLVEEVGPNATPCNEASRAILTIKLQKSWTEIYNSDADVDPFSLLLVQKLSDELQCLGKKEIQVLMNLAKQNNDLDTWNSLHGVLGEMAL